MDSEHEDIEVINQAEEIQHGKKKRKKREKFNFNIGGKINKI